MNNYCVQQKKDVFIFQNETHSVQKNYTFFKIHICTKLFLKKNDILIQFFKKFIKKYKAIHSKK
jgi:hypothetical protein